MKTTVFFDHYKLPTVLHMKHNTFGIIGIAEILAHFVLDFGVHLYFQNTAPYGLREFIVVHPVYISYSTLITTLDLLKM